MSSSRRTTGDINILAMLDGQVPGRRLRVLPAAFRYGAAGVLACSLLATLVWLVQDDTPARAAGKDDAAQASLHPGTAGPAARPAGATAPRDTQPARTHDVELIVTQRDDLLPAGESMSVSVPGTRTAPATETLTSPAPGPASTPVPLQVPHPATAQATSPARTPPGSQAALAKAPSLARTGPPTAHQKRGAAASRTAPLSTVDRDVAVISAILQHAGTRNEAPDAAAAPACPDKSCVTRMPSRQ